jgi:hypothetical protein
MNTTDWFVLIQQEHSAVINIDKGIYIINQELKKIKEWWNKIVI